MAQVIENYMTTKEAAEYLGYDPDYVCSLCINNKLPGAGKFGNAWAIPKQSVHEYKPGLQGQAAVNARKEAEREAQRAEFNAAIQEAKARKQEED